MSSPKTIWKPILLALLAAVMIPPLAGCGPSAAEQPPAVRSVRAVKVGDATVLAGRSFPGRATATREIDLAFRVSGPLDARPVDVGHNVKTGDLVARIDPQDFEVNVRNVQAQLAEAQAQSVRADGDLRRELDLFKRNPGATTQATIDQRRSEQAQAAANVEALTASLTTARDQLSYTQLQAPFDGTVVATYVENFQNVRAKQPIVRILDKSEIEMVVNIPETLIHMAGQIERVHIEFDAFRDRKFEGTIKEIGKEASVTTRTFPVTVIMKQPEDIEILPGMAGRASAADPPVDAAEQTQIVIPVTALFATTAGEQSNVWVIDPQSNTVGLRQVTLGNLLSGGQVVETGLDPGDLVATAGVHFLVEGQQVTPTIE